MELDASPRRSSFCGHVVIGLDVLVSTAMIELHVRELKLSGVTVKRGSHKLTAHVQAHPERQTIEIHLSRPLPPGRATLRIGFAGKLSNGMHGLYLAKDGADSAVVSQCEATDARSIFPCFDEPGFKATLRWTVRTDPGLMVITNGRPASCRRAGHRAVHRFEPTRVMSSYLAAITIGRYEASKPKRIGRVPNRIIAVPGKQGQTASAQQVTAHVLPWYEAYFAHPYYYQKLDQVAVPGFDAGAMENVGAIFYRQSLLLMQPGATSWQGQKRIAEVIAHEIAHMWFGNLVTMIWWDDLWLNEAFASFMAYKAIDVWQPDWRIWDDFLEASQGALTADALLSTHPIYSEVKSPAEATELFDVITYEKGCAVLRMVERYLGETSFRDGMRRYIAKHKNGNASGRDLWQALGAQVKQPVEAMMQPWISGPGFPLVAVSHFRRDGRDILHLSQRRFFANRDEMVRSHDEIWPIPVVVRYGDANGTHCQRLLVSEREMSVAIEADTPVRWLYANADAAGFYRLHFEEACLRRLLSEGLSQLTPAERVSLIEDQWALVRNGLSDCEQFMDLVAAFHNERDHMVTRTLVNRLASLDDYLVRDDERPLLAALVRNLFSPHLAELGWEPLPEEAAAEAVRRAVLVQALAKIGRDPTVISEAEHRQAIEAEQAASVEPNLAGAVVQVTALQGDTKRLSTYVGIYAARWRARLSPELQSRYLHALCWFKQPAVVKRILRLCIDGTLPQDQLRLVLAPMLSSHHSARLTWLFLKKNWKAIAPRIGSMGMARLVEATGALPLDLRADVERFFAENPVDEAQRALKKALEAMALRAELITREASRLGDWLRRNRALCV